jgi:hypothetical protein
MSDEQIIYLGPEEDLTDVRQRLEQAPAEHLILVVPPQTKLRSHVGWRLLHARTRELGKQVLVVSSDRQIRAVVKVAGFKVAESLTSPPTSRPRPGSRPGRLTHGARGSARMLSSRQRSEQQRTPSSIEARPAASQPLTPGSRPMQRSAEPYIEDLTTTTGFFREPPSAPDVELQPPARPPAARPGSPSYDFQVEPIDATSSISPASPFISSGREEEPEDMLLEDFQTAQRIRQAAREGPDRPPAALDRQAYRTSPLSEAAAAQPETDEDPFSRLEEIAASPLPEQRGTFVPIDEFEEEIPAISGHQPRGAGIEAEIEDLGDQGDIVLPSTRPSQARGSASGREMPPAREQELDRSPATLGPQTRLDPLAAPFEGRGSAAFADRELEDADALPAIDALPTSVLPGRAEPPRVVSGSLASGAPPSSARLAREPAPSHSRSARADRRPVASRAADADASRAGARRRSRSPVRSALLFVASAVIVLVLLGAVAYYAPGADVTFTLPAHSFSQTLRFTANATSKLDLAAHTVPARPTTVTFTAQDQGRATGVTQVGLVKAHGTVVFTNKSSRALVIPTGTIIATPGGIQFRTTAEPLITPGATYPVQVEAVNAGTSSNVPANSITVIPPASLQQIGAASGDLTVTNPQPTSGGGAGSAPQVTAADASAVQSTLHTRLQQQLQAWLTQHARAGDVPGKPLQEEHFTASPAVGQAAPQGTFSATLTLQTTVLLIRASDLQAAAAAALQAAVTKQQQGYTLLPQGPVSISALKSTPSNDGQSITVVFTATGLVAPAISDQDIQHLLIGKPKDQALRDLSTLLATRFGKQPIPIRTAISVSPGFYPWMPLIEDHIHIHKNIVTAG